MPDQLLSSYLTPFRRGLEGSGGEGGGDEGLKVEGFKGASRRLEGGFIEGGFIFKGASTGGPKGARSPQGGLEGASP